MTSTNFALKLEKPYRGGIWGFVSYAYGDSKVVNDGTSSRAVSNFQYNEQLNPNDAFWPAQVGLLRCCTASTLSVAYSVQRQRPVAHDGLGVLQPTVGPALSQLYLRWPGLRVEHQRGQLLRQRPVLRACRSRRRRSSSNGTWEQWDAFVSVRKSASTASVAALPSATTAMHPGSTRLDIHLAQDIPIKGTRICKFTFDILNFMNLLDKRSWF